MGLAHLLACFWYGIGDRSAPDAWVTALHYQNASLEYRYTTSLHWALAQFAGGMDEVRPYNVHERTYAIAVFLFSFIVAAVSISAITSSMTQLHILGSNQSLKLSFLRRYLERQEISQALSLRVMRNAKHALAEQQCFTSERNVELLLLVSEPLKAELHFEMYTRIYDVHPFFSKYVEECPQVMRQVSHLATSLLMMSSGDIVFSAGEKSSTPRMFIVTKGRLQYTGTQGTAQLVTPHGGMVIAEAALWTSWMHRGILVAIGESSLMALDADKFKTIVTQFEHSGLDPIQYALRFLEQLNDLGDYASDICEEPMLAPVAPRAGSTLSPHLRVSTGFLRYSFRTSR
jgi:hypothetical protein